MKTKKAICDNRSGRKSKVITKPRVSKKQYVVCDTKIDGTNYKGDCNLPPNEKYKLIIDYPVSNWAEYTINTGGKGMGTNSLIAKICKCYEKVYENEERYGVWGHDISDLFLEGIEVDHVKKVIRLDVGS